jgi:elongation factor G
VEPLVSDDEDFVFEVDRHVRQLREEYLGAVERGCREAMESGVLGGYRQIGVKAKLVDAEVDEDTSSELAFEAAATIAFNRAVESARPVLLEPVMNLEVIVPENYTGEVIADLNVRSAEIRKLASRTGGFQVVSAVVPLAKMFGYATGVRSLTQGRGTFTMEFYRYSEVDSQRMDAIIYGAG